MKYVRFVYAALFSLLPTLLHGQVFFSASLTPDQEPNGSTGEGSGTAAFVTTEDGLRFIVTVDGLTGAITGAHFHNARAGVNGGVVRTITGDFDGTTATGVWSVTDDEPLTEELIAALWAGDLYLNVHTSANQGGELRGQIHPSSGTGFTAQLTKNQEGGPVVSDASGTASVLLTGDIAVYAVSVTGLTGPLTGAHFHNGRMGENGGVVKTITGDFDGPTAIGMWTSNDDEPLTEELIARLLTGNLYLNVHTMAHAGGEIRGQVLLNSGWGFTANLDPEQENNNIESDGAGTAALTLTPDGLVFNVSFEGLTGPIIGAHFHRAAMGMNGGVVRTITDDFDGATASGVWRSTDEEPLTDELIAALFSGELYLNLHTTANMGGEIRGQVLRGEGASFSANLDTYQQLDDIPRGPSGTASMWLTDEGLAFSVTVDSLSGDIVNAHFHVGDIGVGGGVVRGILGDFEGNTANGIWTAADDQPLTDELRSTLLMGGLYINVHTAANEAGEARGQVLLNAGTTLGAKLDPDQVTGDIESNGSGVGTVTVTPTGVVYRVTLDSLTGPIGNAHFHIGAIGENGGVVKSIASTFDGNTAFGTWTADDEESLTAERLQSLIAGDLYLNIHTGAYAGGEIRGQALLSSGTGAAVQLDADQAGAQAGGSGTSTLSLNPAGLAYRVSVTGLTGPVTLAHFHRAPFGMNGGVVRTITDEFDGPTASGLWTANDAEALTTDLVLAVLAGETYINIHTSANQGGEIRGQVRPNRAVVTAVEQVDAEIPTELSLRPNFPNPFNPSTQLEFTLNRAANVTLTVYNLLGQEVRVLVDERLSAGVYRAEFIADGLPSGLYLARLDAEGTQAVRSMLLLK